MGRPLVTIEFGSIDVLVISRRMVQIACRSRSPPHRLRLLVVLSCRGRGRPPMMEARDRGRRDRHLRWVIRHTGAGGLLRRWLVLLAGLGGWGQRRRRRGRRRLDRSIAVARYRSGRSWH